MNKIYVYFALFIFIILYCLNSCTPATRPVKKTPVIESGTEKPIFLGNRHLMQGMECGSCHKEDTPSNSVSTGVCVGCHSDYSPSDRPPVTNYKDPHNSHASFSDCNECHNAHKPSKDFCSTCHGNLGFNTP